MARYRLKFGVGTLKSGTAANWQIFETGEWKTAVASPGATDEVELWSESANLEFAGGFSVGTFDANTAEGGEWKGKLTNSGVGSIKCKGILGKATIFRLGTGASEIGSGISVALTTGNLATEFEIWSGGRTPASWEFSGSSINAKWKLREALKATSNIEFLGKGALNVNEQLCEGASVLWKEEVKLSNVGILRATGAAGAIRLEPASGTFSGATAKLELTGSGASGKEVVIGSSAPTTNVPTLLIAANNVKVQSQMAYVFPEITMNIGGNSEFTRFENVACSGPWTSNSKVSSRGKIRSVTNTTQMKIKKTAGVKAEWKNMEIIDLEAVEGEFQLDSESTNGGNNKGFKFNKQTLETLETISQSQSLVIAKISKRILSLGSPQQSAATISKLPLVNRTVVQEQLLPEPSKKISLTRSLAQIQTSFYNLSTLHSFLISQSQSLLNSKLVGRSLAFAVNPVVSVKALANHEFFVFIHNNLELLKGIGKSQNLSQPQSTLFEKFTSLTRSLPQPQSVVISKTVSLFQTITQSQLVELTRIRLKSLFVTQEQEVEADTPLISKKLTVAQPQTLSVLVGHVFRQILETILQSQSVTLASKKVFPRTLSYVQNFVVSRTQASSRTLFLFEKPKIDEHKKVGKSQSVTQAQVTTHDHKLAKVLLVVQEAILSIQQAIARTLKVQQEQEVTTTRGFFETLRVTQEQIVQTLFTRAYFQTLILEQPTVVAIRKQVGSKLLVLQSQIANVSRGEKFFSVISGILTYILGRDTILSEEPVSSVTTSIDHLEDDLVDQSWIEFILGQEGIDPELAQYEAVLVEGEPDTLTFEPSSAKTKAQKSGTGGTNDPQWH